MKKLALAAAPFLALVSAGASAQVVDGSFETQGAASAPCYFANFFTQCSPGAWSGTGRTSGILPNDYATFQGTSPAGSYFGFIQSGFGAPGGLTQNLVLQAGSYSLRWLDAGRADNNLGNQTYDVLLDGVSIFSGSVVSAQPFAARSAAFAVASAGSYALTFQARDSGGDNAAFIDDVLVAAAVPEPATWGLMLLGFGLTGAGMRSRSRSTTVTYA